MKRIRWVILAALMCIMFSVNTYANESADQIWDYLINVGGYSEPVTAGILGNIMTEVGGDTLAIKPYAWSPYGYYGICQWASWYYPDIMDCDLDTQCQYIIDTIEKEFNEFGYLSGYSYESFLEISDPSSAAAAFSATYERNSGGSYQRQLNAAFAYDYYTS